jgi:hypothetical protein
MAAVYPNSVKSFVNTVDNTDTVIASDVNLAYAEISAIESVLGTTPSATLGWTGSFDQTSSDFTTVTNRIQNAEYGLNIAYNQRVNTLGGSTIGSSSTTVGLTLQTSGTGNLANFKNTSGTIVTSVTKDGWINVIDGGAAS